MQSFYGKVALFSGNQIAGQAARKLEIYGSSIVREGAG